MTFYSPVQSSFFDILSGMLSDSLYDIATDIFWISVCYSVYSNALFRSGEAELASKKKCPSLAARPPEWLIYEIGEDRTPGGMGSRTNLQKTRDPQLADGE